ncbi:hypothetical protein Dda_6659 [Drechslerella dactyloides]|uniref:Uncharacterized protein n=1 Tax=Drechslerella dactyloides TaxID=74499 RepID=A0AAD6IY83_DREDA|nr:hypothetical protein Dda_6659 [Drechslerella dactyloides]
MSKRGTSPHSSSPHDVMRAAVEASGFDGSSSSFQAQDIYSVLQSVSSNRRTSDPQIFGSSMFTGRLNRSSAANDEYYYYDELEEDGCWDAIEEDPYAVEFSTSRGSYASGMRREGAGSNSSRAGSSYGYWGTQTPNEIESIDSRFATLAIATSSSSRSRRSPSDSETREHKAKKTSSRAPSKASARSRPWI